MAGDRDVCMGWIHNGTVRAEFMESVLALLDTTTLIGRYVTFSAGAHLAAARNAVAAFFLDGGPETWHRTDFDYYGIAVRAYAHVPAGPAST